MGFFKSTKGSLISEYFKILEDVAQYKAGNMVNVLLHDDHLELSVPIPKIQPITLDYKKITDVYYGFESEIVRKNKSVIGRAFTGGLLFGGAGAVVGAISGTGVKEKKEIHRLFIVSYTPSGGGEAYLKFYDTRCFKGKRLAEKLKELCGIKENVVTSL